jgi:hypothetical protein
VVQKNKLLGHHDDFAQYVGTHTYLYMYSKNLKDAPLEIASLARQKLPEGFGSNSLMKSTWDDDDNSTTGSCCSKKKHCKRLSHGNDCNGDKGKSEKARMAAAMESMDAASRN